MRDYSEVIPVIEQRVKQQMENDSTGHDWWHVDRVRRTALIICEREQGNAERVELVALLHDVDDWKLKKEPTSESLANQWLLDAGVSEEESHQICEIIDRISFKGHGVEDNMPFLDGQIVQDADRLDAIGAIGIARCFAFGGERPRDLRSP